MMHRKEKKWKVLLFNRIYCVSEAASWVQAWGPEIQSNQKLTQSNHREMQSDFKEMQNGCREMGHDHREAQGDCRGRGSIVCRPCPEFLKQPRPEAKVYAELLILCLIRLLLILWPSLQVSCFLTLEAGRAPEWFLHTAQIWYGWAAGERGCLISKEWSALSKYVALHHVPHISALFFLFSFFQSWRRNWGSQAELISQASARGRSSSPRQSWDNLWTFDVLAVSERCV